MDRLTEHDLIHQGWRLWDDYISIRWRSFLRGALLNKPATRLYCKTHQRDDAELLLEQLARHKASIARLEGIEALPEPH